ncbi:MAG: putative manganese-dependent inorganic diphosphatase [Nanobdellota archaeon]
MVKPIIITGHKNPDTDSICSAIAYADLKTKMGDESISVRLGELNKETEFVLKRFGVDAPELVKDVHARVKDLSMDDPVRVYPHNTIFQAWNTMKSEAVKSVAVVDNVNHLLGVTTLSDIASRYMDIMQENLLSESDTPLQNILDVLDGRLLVGDVDSFSVKGRVVIGAMTPEKMKEYVVEDDMVILGNREENQLAALEKGIGCLIITGNSEVNDIVLEKASSIGAFIISSPKDTYQTVRAINQSIPVSSVMSNDDIVSFNQEEYVHAVKKKMTTTRFATYPVVDASNKIVGFISRYHLLNPPRTRVVLVDHNERSQSAKGIEDTEILEIVDHHRIGDVQSSSPIRFINDPVGSTATIISERYFSEQVALDPSIAGLLLSAILSDTLKFTSPTTTDRDKVIASKLASIADVDIDEYAMEMFKAGTSIEGKTPEELFHQDFKEYDVSDLRIGIAQVPTMDFDSIKTMKERILAFMQENAAAQDYDVLALVLTNVIDGNSEIVFSGEKSHIIRDAFNVPEDANEAFLEGVVSRKKQIVPVISRKIEN